MKHCFTCKRNRPDNAKFCPGCGSTFDVRYCPRLHLNSPTAEYCTECGSSDLSAADHRPPESKMMVIFALAAGFTVLLVSYFLLYSSLQARSPFLLLLIILAASVFAIFGSSNHRNKD